MKRYCFTIAILTAFMLSACSGINREPVESTGEPSVVEADTEPIRIESEKKSEAATEEMESEGDPSAVTSGEGGTAAAAENVPAETEAPVVYAVTALQKTMYVTQPVHVRASYTMKSDVLTSFGTNQKVEVTGRSANGWMRIVYNGKDAYIYQKYLSESRTVSQNGNQINESQPGGEVNGGTTAEEAGTGVAGPAGQEGPGGIPAESTGETSSAGPGGSPSTGSQSSNGPSTNQNTEQIQTIPSAPIGGIVETLVPGEVSGPGVSPAGAVPGAAPGM